MSNLEITEKMLAEIQKLGFWNGTDTAALLLAAQNVLTDCPEIGVEAGFDSQLIIEKHGRMFLGNPISWKEKERHG